MKYLLILLFPTCLFSQTLQEVDFVDSDYYKVIVSDTLYSQHTSQKECLEQVTNLAINQIDSHCQQPWIDVVTQFTDNVVEVYDTVNVESLTLRQVNYSYTKAPDRYLSYQAEAYGDSVRFEYYRNAQIIRDTTITPFEGFAHDTLRAPPLDTLQVWIHGYWDKWVEPFHEIVDIALIDTLGEEPTPEPPDTTTMGTFFRSFNDDTLGALPSGFTELFGSSGSWTVVEFATAGPDQYLNQSAGGTGRDAVGWEQGTDVEIVTKYYRDGTSIIGGPAGRMDTGGAETGYTVWNRAGANSKLVRHETGTETALVANEMPPGHRWVIVRLRINSSTIQMRIHPVETIVGSARATNDDFVLGPRHEFRDNMAVTLTADTMPGGLATETTYYVRRIDDNQFALQASSPVDGGASDIDITSDGSNITFALQDDETARTDWPDEVTDTNITGSGYAGLFDIFGNCYFEWIGIGTAGDTAPSSGGASSFEASFSMNSAMQAASSSVSTAEAGISLDTGADVSDGSTATGESLLTISHNQNASTQSDAQAEAAMSLSNLLQIAFSKQSVTDASFSMPVVHQVTTVSDTQIINEASFSLALQKAITTEQISTIEVSYSLNSAQQTAMQSVSTAEAAMSITLSAAINFISTALAEADISFNAVQSLTFSGQTVGVEVTLADGRTLTISLENRTYLIPQETRTFTILSENRTLTIEP